MNNFFPCSPEYALDVSLAREWRFMSPFVTHASEELLRVYDSL